MYIYTMYMYETQCIQFIIPNLLDISGPAFSEKIKNKRTSHHQDLTMSIYGRTHFTI
jgi:hypothetical protein